MLPTIMSEVSQATIEPKQTSSRKLHKVESKKFDIAPISLVREKKNLNSVGDLLTERQRSIALHSSILDAKQQIVGPGEQANS